MFSFLRRASDPPSSSTSPSLSGSKSVFDGKKVNTLLITKLDFLAKKLAEASGQDAVRAALNDLYDVVQAQQTPITPVLLQALLKAMSEFKGESGLMTAVMTILTDCLLLNDQNSTEIVDDSIKHVFYAHNGPVTVANVLGASTSNLVRLNGLKVLEWMYQDGSTEAFCPAVHAIVQLMTAGASGELVREQAFHCLQSILDDHHNPNPSELQKLAVFGGALDHCWARLLQAAQAKDEQGLVVSMECLTLLISRNATTAKEAFGSGARGWELVGQVPLLDSVAVGPACMKLILAVAQTLKSQAIPPAILKIVDEHVDSLLTVCPETIWELFTTCQHENSLAQQKAFEKSLNGPESLLTASAIRYCESMCYWDTSLVPDLLTCHSLVAYRLVAPCRNVPLPSFVEGLRGLNPVGFVAAWILRTMRKGKSVLAADSVGMQALIQGVLVPKPDADGQLLGSLLAILLCLHLSHTDDQQGLIPYPPSVLRQLIADRIGEDEMIARVTLPASPHLPDEMRFNGKAIQQASEQARQNLLNRPVAISAPHQDKMDEAFKALQAQYDQVKAERDELLGQVSTYRNQLMTLEEDYTRVLALLGQYEAEVAATVQQAHQIIDHEPEVTDDPPEETANYDSATNTFYLLPPSEQLDPAEPYQNVIKEEDDFELGEHKPAQPDLFYL